MINRAELAPTEPEPIPLLSPSDHPGPHPSTQFSNDERRRDPDQFAYRHTILSNFTGSRASVHVQVSPFALSSNVFVAIARHFSATRPVNRS
jgi:hypothetical protein